MDMYDDMADKGRKGDTYVGHLTGGEMVVPVTVLNAKDGFLRKAITDAMKDMEVNPDQFTVGHKDNSVNPKTGQIEFGLLSKIVKAAKSVVSTVTDAVGITDSKPKGPSAAELKAVEDAKKRVAQNQANLNKRETNLAREKQSALRARKGRAGVYSLLGSEDRLG